VNFPPLAKATLAKPKQNMIIRKQDIYTLDIEHWAELPQEEFLAEVEGANLNNYSTWLLPQLVAHFGRWQLYSSGKETVAKNTHNLLDKVFYRLTRVRRSSLIKNQTQQPEYGQLTPLILLGFKQAHGYSYEQFRELDGLEWLLEPLLYSALVEHDPPNLTADRLLAIRTQGLVYRTGPKAGQSRNPESTWQLYSISDTELGEQTKLLQSMLCQIWLAHPKHRRASMILDPHDWDHMPEPLVDAQPLANTTTKKKSTLVRELMPWD
jgi:hypothetical protein